MASPELSGILWLLREVGRAETLQDLAQAVLRFAQSLVPKAQAGSVLLLNEFSGRFEFAAALGWDFARLRTVSFPKDVLIQQRIYGDKPAIIRDILALDRAHFGPELVEKLAEVGQVAATLTLPLLAKGKLIGYLNLDHKEDPAAFSGEDLERLLPYQDIFAGLLELGREREELKEGERLFRLLFERLADAVYITAFDGTILEANPAAEKQTGYSRAELIGKNIMRDIAAEEPAITYEKANERLARGETVVFEEKKRRKDGTFYWTECAVVQFTYKGRPATLSLNRDITERKKLEEELQRRVEELSALNQAVAALTAHLERRKVLEALVEIAKGVSRADYANVLLLSPEGVPETVDPLAEKPLPLRMRPRGFTSLILRTGKPVVVGDIRPDGSCIPPVLDEEGKPIPANPVLLEQGVRSTVGLPLRVGGRVQGVFYVHSRTPHSLPDRLPILTLLAHHAEIALENVALFEEQRKTAEVLRRLNAVFVRLSSILELPDLFRLIAQELRRFISFDAFFVAVVDAQREKIVPLFALEEGEEIALPELPLDPKESTTAWVIVRGEPLFLEDVERMPPPVPFKTVGRPTRAWAGIPLVAQAEVIGILSVQSFSPIPFGEREKTVLLGFSSAAAAALHNALLLRQVRQTAEKLRRLEEASRRLKMAQAKEELYGIALDAVAQVFGFRYAAVLEAHEDALVLVAHRGYPPELLGMRLPFSGGKGVTVAAYLANEPLYVPDVREDPRYVAGLPTAGAELAIPISIGEKRFGVLNVEHDQIDGIPPEDRELLKILAAELAVALLGLARLESLRDLSQKLEILHEISQRLQRCTTVEEVCRTAVEATAERLGLFQINIGLVRDDFLVPVAEAGDLLHKARPFRKGEGIAGKTWATGKTIWGNVEDFPEAKPVDPRIRSFISAPIGDRGVLQALADRPDFFTPDDVRVVEILARHVYEELRRVELEAELREQAIRDPLTGLYNRRFLDEVLRREIARAERYGHPLSLILIDIDNFKELNDRYGHLVGDEALRRVAKALRENIRRVDYIFRWGGDEFCVILPETNGPGAKEVVRRFQEPFGILAEEPVIRLTLGYASWDPRKEPAPSVEDLFRRADQLLYEMKRAKSNP
ncbi:MAG: GAF domain-containing protein [Candidatus Bipolaricaulaceae bacterium]